MNIGLIGLGKMGYNLALNLMEHQHEVVAYDIDSEVVANFKTDGGKGANSILELVSQLPSPKVVWVMVPAGEITTNVINELTDLLSENDIVIDGGNSKYKDSIARAEKLKSKGIHFLDVGTSGGISGARNGACMMIGGDKSVFQSIEQIFKDTCVNDGYLYCGKHGSGHFLKMVHNGVEYGMMQAIAEGFEVLYKSEYDYDLEKVAKNWNNGSVVRSWLMELMEDAFSKDANLEEIKGVMHSSGEGKWTVETALDLQVPTPVITLALMMRYRSLESDTFSGKVIAALRNGFGGHAIES
ncbi:phosphogluconate dehydrogenase (NAD(+)-dependent, decarboxylating) [Bacillus andreraoultii]|uniref:phosphogluconate dehydrogenase (NAD(+)-dependent, decarboxylating) n=1 Tax=Bacillus andreraoultii TaxID=1499685 RepID=UPI00053A28B0|nr:decarboxylating 6-phosphogluconate dehydrogenase [Bacillus andreraoultii]